MIFLSGWWWKGMLVMAAGVLVGAGALWALSYGRPWKWIGERGAYTYSVTNQAGGVEVVRFAREAEEEGYGVWRVRYWMVVVSAGAPAVVGTWGWARARRNRGRGFPVET